MRSNGALLASIGTSAMLVAAATLSLLSVSAVFALGGFEGTGDASSVDALVLDDAHHGRSADHAAAGGVTATPVAVVARTGTAAPRRRPAAGRSARRHDPVRANASTTTPPAARTSQVDSLGKGVTGPPAAPRQPTPPPAAKKSAPNLGDGVKQLGDNLSSTVQQTGSKLAEATAPLSSTVSDAVQQLMNIIAGVIKGTTDGLGGVLGATR